MVSHRPPPLPVSPSGILVRTLPPARTCGVDEVGRGPLAGPVVAAAVILPEAYRIVGIADSKTLSPARRQALAEAILAVAEVGIAVIPAPEIDRLNILQASLLAMRRAVEALPAPPDEAWIDGNRVPPGLPCRGHALVGGDGRSPLIAAASIVAKVFRDRMMAAAGARYPGYGFERDAGYPTPRHRQAILELGLTPLHRRSFAPCRAAASVFGTGGEREG